MTTPDPHPRPTATPDEEGIVTGRPPLPSPYEEQGPSWEVEPARAAAPGVLSGITVDCVDPAVLARFWGGLLGRAEEPSLPGWRQLGARDGADPRINFQPVPEPKDGKVRIHLDVTVPDVEAGIRTVRAMGGRQVGERQLYDEGVVVVMADPEDNEFCIVEYF